AATASPAAVLARRRARRGRMRRAVVRRALLHMGEILAREGSLPFLQLLRASARRGDRQLENRERLRKNALPHERLRREASLLSLAGEDRLRGEDEPGALRDAPREARRPHHLGEHDLRRDRVWRKG